MTPETDPLGKTVLLVDNHQKAREVRAQRLTVYGIVVDAVSTVREARFCLRHKRYDLVLLAVRGNAEETIVFSRGVCQHNPKQKVAFLVGPPDYLSFTYGENVIPMPAQSSDWAEKLKARLAS